MWRCWNKNYNHVVIFSVAIRSYNSPSNIGTWSLSFIDVLFCSLFNNQFHAPWKWKKFRFKTTRSTFNETETFKLSDPHRVDLKQSVSPGVSVSVEESLRNTMLPVRSPSDAQYEFSWFKCNQRIIPRTPIKVVHAQNPGQSDLTDYT